MVFNQRTCWVLGMASAGPGGLRVLGQSEEANPTCTFVALPPAAIFCQHHLNHLDSPESQGVWTSVAIFRCNDCVVCYFVSELITIQTNSKWRKACIFLHQKNKHLYMNGEPRSSVKHFFCSPWRIFQWMMARTLDQNSHIIQIKKWRVRFVQTGIKYTAHPGRSCQGLMCTILEKGSTKYTVGEIFLNRHLVPFVSTLGLPLLLFLITTPSLALFLLSFFSWLCQFLRKNKYNVKSPFCEKGIAIFHTHCHVSKVKRYYFWNILLIFLPAFTYTCSLRIFCQSY